MQPVVFDANGTLFDLAPVAEALGGHDRLEAFFARLLHSAATCTAVGAWAPFDDLAAAALATTRATLHLEDVDQPRVLTVLSELPAFPDAADAVRLAGRPAILTNSPAGSTRQLVERAGLPIGTVISCDEVRAYKPSPAPYLLAKDRLGDFTLIAAHAWDVVGARACGLRAIWVSRDERSWPFPHLEVGETSPTLVAAARQAAADGRADE